MKKYNAEQACLEVKRIVEDFGMDIILDTQRFSAALDDYLATMESERTVLRNAMQAPLGTMLHEARTASEADQGRVLMQARQMLIEEYGLESRAASFSIDCIVYAIWPQEDATDEEDELEELQRKAKTAR